MKINVYCLNYKGNDMHDMGGPSRQAPSFPVLFYTCMNQF